MSKEENPELLIKQLQARMVGMENYIVELSRKYNDDLPILEFKPIAPVEETAGHCGENSSVYNAELHAYERHDLQCGMSLMDYFAAQAMPMLLNRYMSNGISLTECKKLVAAASYAVAKEMLKEREKE